jgi:hypothetical protein
MPSTLSVLNNSISGNASTTGVAEIPRLKRSTVTTPSADSDPSINEDEKADIYKDADYLTIENLNVIPAWLVPCHCGAAICQFLQALFLFTFASQVDVKWCLYSNYPELTHEDIEEETNIYATPHPVQLICYNITWYAGIFISMSGIFHVVHITPPLKDWIMYRIERHQSPMRWAEYSFSCSLMRLYVAQVAGVTDVCILVMVFFLTQSAMCFVMLYEMMNAKNRADGYKQNHTAIVFAFIANLISWGIIFAFFAAGFGQIEASLSAVILMILFVLELSFPIVFFLQWYKVGAFKDYLIGEFAYIILSFTTKTFLAWATVIGANTLSLKL